MPAVESIAQSIGCPVTFVANDGREVTIRNGCVVVDATREVLTSSEQTAKWLLSNARLSRRDREHIEYWGGAIFGAASYEPISKAQNHRSKYG